MATSSSPISDGEYFTIVERLAHLVCEEAALEGWLTFDPVREPPGESGLQRSINELARNLRYTHYDGDGCLAH